MGRFDGQECVICPNPSVGVGEHVWPRWLLHEFAGQGPFSTDKSGSPILNRDSQVATNNTLQGTHVPMCTTCNEGMNVHIEVPAQPVIRKLMPKSPRHTWPTLTADECAAVGRWFLKVGLLLSHPRAQHDNPLVERYRGAPRRGTVPLDHLTWLPTCSPPPEGYSVFVQRRQWFGDVGPWPKPTALVGLPTVCVAGEVFHFMARHVGIRGLDATIVWHPGWPIAHPLVEQGRAVQLWPDPTNTAFATLPDVHPSEFGFVSSGMAYSFAPERYRPELLEPLNLGLPSCGTLWDLAGVDEAESE